MDNSEVPPKNFSQRLKSRRKALELSQKQLSEFTEISAKTIQNYEYGDNPKGPNLVRLSRALNCSIDWLLLGSGWGSEDSEQEHDELIYIPKVLPRLNSAGETLEKSQKMYAFRHDWIKQKGNPSQMILMEVSGNSMSPEIKDGDTVLTDRSQTDIYIGKIYAVSIGQEITVRYVDRAPGKIILRGAHHACHDIDIGIHEDSTEPANILGRVLWWCRDVKY